jgi:AcrR family transcriptional regulator
VTWPGRPGSTRTGRRAGDSGTREAILSASRAQFAEHGYDGATIRSIARAAGVDPALVHHYFGGKEKLFAAAMKLPFIPSEVIATALKQRDPGESLGTHMVRTALSVWESAEVRDAFQTMLRSALTSEPAAATLREFVTESILRPLASAADGGVAERIPFRASLVATQMLGLALGRYVLRFGPVAGASADEIATAVGPTIDRYLTGDIDEAKP